MKENGNLGDAAYEKIKRMILSGELRQGQAFSINAMADALHISRTPVTDACRRLEFEKLLTILPKQGAVISTISLEAACGIYELRAAIESYNARKIMDSLTEKDAETLAASVRKQKECAARGDSLAFMDEDIFFHRYILEKNINYELLSVVNQLYDRAYILGIKNSRTARMAQSVEEHEDILKALKKRDRQAFADAIETNILNGFRSLTAQFLE